MKFSFVIYTDLECWLENMSTCHNNPEKPSTNKLNEHPPSGYSLFIQCSFDATKNKLNCYWAKYCLKHFSKDLKKMQQK